MNLKSRIFPAFALALPLAWISPGGPAPVQAAEPAQPLALRGVMQQLGRDMQAVTAAISTEDWAVVAELAPRIARHEQPPAREKLRILSWLGGEAGKFRGLDGEVEQAAAALGEAARSGDGQGVIAAFAKTQQSCLACHQSFRSSFIQHFHGQ